MSWCRTVVRGVAFAGLGSAIAGCGEEVDPFSFCPEDSAAEMLRPEGDLTVDFRDLGWYSPQIPFRTYVQQLEDGSVHLAACQVDDIGQMWHLRTRWSQLPDVVEELTYATVSRSPVDDAVSPLRFEGFLNVCKGAECQGTDSVLKFFGSLPHAVWVDHYSANEGEMAGGIVSVYMPREDTSDAIQIYFDLEWRSP